MNFELNNLLDAVQKAPARTKLVVVLSLVAVIAAFGIGSWLSSQPHFVKLYTNQFHSERSPEGGVFSPTASLPPALKRSVVFLMTSWISARSVHDPVAAVAARVLIAASSASRYSATVCWRVRGLGDRPFWISWSIAIGTSARPPLGGCQ